MGVDFGSKFVNLRELFPLCTFTRSVFVHVVCQLKRLFVNVSYPHVNFTSLRVAR